MSRLNRYIDGKIMRRCSFSMVFLFVSVHSFAVESHPESAKELLDAGAPESELGIGKETMVAGPISGGTSPSISLDFDSANMQDIAAILNDRLQVRVCFEMRSLNVEKDRTSLGETLRWFEEEKKKRPLTEREELRCSLASGYRDGGRDLDSPFDLAEKRITGSFEAQTVEKLLDALTSREYQGSYRWEAGNGTYVIFPRERSILDFRVNLTIEDKSLPDAMTMILAQQPAGLGLEYVPPMGQDYLVAKIVGAKIRKLVLRDVSARTALCRVVEAAGRDFCWQLAGFEGSRILSPVYISRPEVRGQ